jgi:hypothetical protein
MFLNSASAADSDLADSCLKRNDLRRRTMREPPQAATVSLDGVSWSFRCEAGGAEADVLDGFKKKPTFLKWAF